MKRLILSTFCFFFFEYIFCQSISDRVDSLFKTIYHAEEPGAMISIERGDKIIFKRGYGLANLQSKEKIESTTNLNIGSITKQFTAFCILDLNKDGKLSLDDNLNKFFPDFNKKTGNVITIRQLLTHSSGIIDHYAFVDTNIVKHATDQDVLLAVKGIDSTYFTPGTHYRYSNTAYCLLALIIEKISGISYNDFVRKKIFQPLHMDHSTVLKIGSHIDHAAMGYTIHTERNNDKKQFDLLDADQSIFFSTEGDGGIYLSIDDYLKWCNAWQKQNATLMQTAQSPHFLIDASKNLSYGYGWFISEKNKEKIVYHTGSNGGFRAISFFIPASHYHVIVLSNRDDIDLEELVQKINIILHVSNDSFTKIESLVSFAD